MTVNTDGTVGRGVRAILGLARDRHLAIVSMTGDAPPVRRDLDYSDVEADADRMNHVLEMRALGHTDACINDGSPGNEPTLGCAGCETSQHADYPHHPGTLYDCPACEAMGTLDPYAPGVCRDGGPL